MNIVTYAVPIWGILSVQPGARTEFCYGSSWLHLVLLKSMFQYCNKNILKTYKHCSYFYKSIVYVHAILFPNLRGDLKHRPRIKFSK